MHTDLQLLSRYHRHGDAEAFQSLVREHAGMVHATAQRITRDKALAQDVAQETFLALAHSSGSAIRSVGAWLHHVAWQKAKNLVRGEVRRETYECAAAHLSTGGDPSLWVELEPLIDEALADIPEQDRELLIEHYLEGHTQQELAHRLGLSQSTVSRQLEEGLRLLRGRLKSKGVLGGASLASIFSTQASQAAPPSLSAALGKIALSGVGASPTLFTGTVTLTPLLAMSTTKLLFSIAAVATLATAPLVYQLRSPAPLPAAPPTTPAPKAAATAKPKPAKPSSREAEAFDQLFGGKTDRREHARALVDDYLAAHPGKSLLELAADPALTSRLGKLMEQMMTQPEVGKKFGEAMEFAMKMKGLHPSPRTRVSFNIGEGFLHSESQAERYLGAILSNDAAAMAQLFTDMMNEAAAEMALDPGIEKSSSGVSIQQTPDPTAAAAKED